MRRILALFLAAALVFAFAACEKAPAEDVGKEAEGETENTDTPDEGGEEQPFFHDDSEYVNAQTISDFANTNMSLIHTDVKGIIVELPGLGGSSCLGGNIKMGEYTSSYANECAANGIVLAYIFPGPWSWGNRAAVRITDAVVAAIAKTYGLGDSFPVAVCGGSMGGLGALIYAADSSFNVVACASACPCTDVIANFASSPSFPRTFVSAVAYYDMPLEDALRAVSPTDRLSDMPDIPYFICSDGEDEVFAQALCDEYVEKLSGRVKKVIYRQQPGKKHGQFEDKVIAELRKFLTYAVVNGSSDTPARRGAPEDFPVIKSGASYDDSAFINKDTVTSFANTNEHLIKGEVKGIIVELPDIGGGSCLGGSVGIEPYETDFAKECAENGIVLAYMFSGPWSWGNRASVRMTDAVIAALADKYSLPEGFPVSVCGGGMGGLGAMIFAADSSYKVSAVAAACPYVDVLKRYAMLSAEKRTFVSAVAGYGVPLGEALATVCPTKRADDLPDVPYFICSDGADTVIPEALCDAFVELLSGKRLDVTYRRQPDLAHGKFTDEVLAQLHAFLIESIK